ncbi:carbohydrate-binding module family 14 protein [Tateyamaria sp. syn59]|uniref:carbohydrate-binding module family 14 protein n=1 Tax=Tateyamaria sp. syn59 TaxID=2576942 RepID=UPI0011BFA1DE|nr:carbohydrate-binding module family 14 protein [Tateyamaria sp. syn59]
MKTKTVLVALALTLAPTLSLAMGCNYDKLEQQAMSCAAGTVYDADTNSCVATTG